MSDQKYMHRALQLARFGNGYVSPNPMVGAVIVHAGRVIGEGWHRVYGGPHAEVHAIQSVKPQDIENIAESTLYVTLEPCHHFGKTPPCVDLVLKHRIKRVVIADLDPNPLTAGKSVEKLRAAGVIITLGVLQAEARHLNRAFLHHITTGTPYIILKWAQTQQGVMGSMDRRLHISGAVAQRLVHKWRSECDAILVGKRTVLLDNPRLDLRHAVTQKELLRIALCPEDEVPLEMHVRDGSAPTWFITPSESMLYILNQRLMGARKPILMVEGGAHTLQTFIEAGAWNEIRCITHLSTDLRLGKADCVFAPKIPVEAQSIESYRLADDQIDVFIRR